MRALGLHHVSINVDDVEESRRFYVDVLGFTPLEAITIGTLNGAKYLGRDARIGSIVVGKQADLVVIDGDPSTTIADVRKVVTVFKQGVGFDPVKLVDAVKGRVGLW